MDVGIGVGMVPGGIAVFRFLLRRINNDTKNVAKPRLKKNYDVVIIGGGATVWEPLFFWRIITASPM
ncbi:MAG: hypothetical protein Ct9H300mP21_11030 [Pseudomonadota bacterium]|nr:MAG: hypothetical protein Ct9H300mP21_11030 [Pseudomonadota bacterium]